MERRLQAAAVTAPGFAVVEAALPQAEFSVDLHHSRRHQADAGLAWPRSVVEEPFRSR
jgi:hypothetical protein